MISGACHRLLVLGAPVASTAIAGTGVIVMMALDLDAVRTVGVVAVEDWYRSSLMRPLNRNQTAA